MIFRKHRLRLSAVKGNHVESAVALKRDPLAVRRPGGMVGIERRESELERLGSIDARAPKCAVELVLVGHPLPVPRKTQVPRRNSCKVGNKSFALGIVANQLPSLLIMHQDNLFAIDAEARFVQPIGTGVQLQGRVPSALEPGRFLIDHPNAFDAIAQGANNKIFAFGRPGSATLAFAEAADRSFPSEGEIMRIAAIGSDLPE